MGSAGAGCSVLGFARAMSGLCLALINAVGLRSSFIGGLGISPQSAYAHGALKKAVGGSTHSRVCDSFDAPM